MPQTRFDITDIMQITNQNPSATAATKTFQGDLTTGKDLRLPQELDVGPVPINRYDQDAHSSDDTTTEHILLGRQVGVVNDTTDATLLTTNFKASIDPATTTGAFAQPIDPLTPGAPQDFSDGRDTGYSEIYRPPVHEADASATWASVGGANGDDEDNAISGSSTQDVISGFGGDDVISGLGGDDTLYGNAGNDQLMGDDGNDQLIGGDGNDDLFGDAGNDSLDGGEGADDLFGGHGDDLLYGGADGDVLDGGHGADLLSGGAGNDVIRGDGGNDRLEGGDGDDILSGGAGTDGFFGGNGRDMVDYSYSSGDWKIDLSGGIATSLTGTVVEGLHSIENATGGSGNDIMIADEAGSWLFGQLGNDQLTGGGFNDWLDGGDGSDNINGMDGDDLIDAGSGDDLVRDGEGDDVIYFGSGDDEFVWNGGNDEVHGGDGANHYTIERWEDVDGGEVSEANAEDINTGGGTLTIHDFDADDTLFIGHYVDLNYWGFQDGHRFNPDTNGDGGVDRYDEGVRLIDGDLHIELLQGGIWVERPAVNTEDGYIEASHTTAWFDEATLVLTNTDFVDMDQFIL